MPNHKPYWNIISRVIKWKINLVVQKNKPLSLTDNKHSKHIEQKLFLSSHHRTHIYKKTLHYLSSAIITSGTLDE